MYDSFESTRNMNKVNYAKLQKLYLKAARLFNKKRELQAGESFVYALYA